MLIAAPVKEGKADVERKEASSVFEILPTDISLSEFVFSAISVFDEDPFILPDRVKSVFAAAKRNPSGLD